LPNACLFFIFYFKFIQAAADAASSLVVSRTPSLKRRTSSSLASPLAPEDDTLGKRRKFASPAPAAPTTTGLDVPASPSAITFVDGFRHEMRTSLLASSLFASLRSDHAADSTADAAPSAAPLVTPAIATAMVDTTVSLASRVLASYASSLDKRVAILHGLENRLLGSASGSTYEEVELDVGGKIFKTTTATLCQEPCYLSAMFSGFVDVFQYVSSHHVQSYMYFPFRCSLNTVTI
jgi:hypothetical protein